MNESESLRTAPVTIRWPHTDRFPLVVYYASSRGRVLFLLDLANNIRLLHKLTPGDYIFSLVTFDANEETFADQRRVLELFGLSRDRVFFICNTEEQRALATRMGLRSVFCNQNALLDENLFTLRSTEKVYDAVSNARLVPFKRVGLAARVPRLALIPGHSLEATEYEDLANVPHVFAPQHYLSPEQIVEVLNQAKVGLILSASEGACFASSEYLLCGLPVVSTRSTGGRDLWYDAENSIICEPNEDAVAGAVARMIQKLESGEIDPHEIRRGHIARAADHRGRFIATLGEMFAAMGELADPARYFRDHFVDKLLPNGYVPFAAVCEQLDATEPAAFTERAPARTAPSVTERHSSNTGKRKHAPAADSRGRLAKFYPLWR